MAVSFSVGFLTIHFARQTGWYQDYLYHQLLSGDEQQRLRAAGSLAVVGAEKQLLEALKAEPPEVHSIAQRGLEHLWFNAAGRKACAMMEQAQEASAKNEFKESLRLLDRLTAEYPKYAEAWNQRAAVLWQMGQYQESKADCERTLALNPNHYGAWQGLGICQLQLGDVVEAVRSLRNALKIAPHEESTRKSLLKCEEFLRSCPPSSRVKHPANLL